VISVKKWICSQNMLVRSQCKTREDVQHFLCRNRALRRWGERARTVSCKIPEVPDSDENNTLLRPDRPQPRKSHAEAAFHPKNSNAEAGSHRCVKLGFL
jgi:hypothetical protein